jgi:hypothetical protein
MARKRTSYEKKPCFRAFFVIFLFTAPSKLLYDEGALMTKTFLIEMFWRKKHS